jgi:hypothetical protein
MQLGVHLKNQVFFFKIFAVIQYLDFFLFFFRVLRATLPPFASGSPLSPPAHPSKQEHINDRQSSSAAHDAK